MIPGPSVTCGDPPGSDPYAFKLADSWIENEKSKKERV